jgi:hypothetical protein
MEIGVRSPDMEGDEVEEDEQELRRSPGDSLHRGNATLSTSTIL